jgi:hypothetical protein
VLTNLANDRARPRSAVLTIVRCSIAVFIVLLLTRTWADPDLWGHVLFGGDAVKARALVTIDPYSFTSDKQWINHEWLAEILMYYAYAVGGTPGLVSLKSTLMLGAIGMVVVGLKPYPLPVVIHDLLVFLAAAAMRFRGDVFRPQVYSLALFCGLLLTLLAAERSRRTHLIAVPVIFLIWANLHGGWIVGLAVVSAWAAIGFLSRESMHSIYLAVVPLAAMFATLINPYGWRLWQFLWTTVGLSRSDISDWQPLWKLPFGVVMPWLTAFVLAALVIVFDWRKIRPSHAAIVVVCALGSLRISRVDAFFVVAVVLLFAPQIGSLYQRTRQRFGQPNEIAKAFSLQTAAIVAAVVVGLALSRKNFSCIEITTGWSPPEPDVVPLVASLGLEGLMLTYFDWGEYAIWHMAPRIKVSMDGRRETVYSDRIIVDHVKIYLGQTGAESAVNELNPDYVWLPSRFHIVRSLESKGWNVLFRGPVSTLLAAKPVNRVESPAIDSLPETLRCFPGP